MANSLNLNGRHEGYRTPDLFRVKEALSRWATRLIKNYNKNLYDIENIKKRCPFVKASII